MNLRNEGVKDFEGEDRLFEVFQTSRVGLVTA